MKIPALFLILSLLTLSNAFGDELVRSRGYFQAEGYRSVGVAKSVSAAADLPGSLPWPVAFVDPAHAVAQNYVNFQMYDADEAYFHGGCDLRSPGNSDVVATVDGVLEGGFYGYVMNADGSMEKQWQPWRGRGRHDPYFELAIVTDDGYRFEFHHVDSEKLPPATIEALNTGQVRVRAGSVIGKVNAWAFAFADYPHIHYNIIRRDGVRMNPEFYSVATPDHTAPRIVGIYGISITGKVMEINQGDKIRERLKEIVVATTESHDHDAYVQTPLLASISFGNSVSFSWDFRRTLLTAEGRFPNIWDVFAREITLPSGETFSTFGQYGQGLSLIRLPVAEQADGEFTVTIGDTAGNQTLIRGTLDSPAH